MDIELGMNIDGHENGYTYILQRKTWTHIDKNLDIDTEMEMDTAKDIEMEIPSRTWTRPWT